MKPWQEWITTLLPLLVVAVVGFGCLAIAWAVPIR